MIYSEQDEQTGYNVDIIKLKCFSMLVKYQSFSTAAYELNISQSSLSKHIMSLENELGVVLFDRKGRKTNLTEAGEKVSVHVLNIINEYDRMLKKVTVYTKSSIHTIRIGIAPMGSQYFWLNKLEKILSAFTKSDIEIFEREEAELVDLSKRGEIEYLIVRNEILPQKGFRKYLLHIDKTVVILPKSHPQAKKKQVALNDLRNENFIFMDECKAPYKIFKDVCHKAGFEPKIVRTTKNVIVTINYIQAGEGIALRFESDTDSINNVNDICVLPVKDNINSEIVLAVPTVRKRSTTEKLLSERLPELKEGKT